MRPAAISTIVACLILASIVAACASSARVTAPPSSAVASSAAVASSTALASSPAVASSAAAAAPSTSPAPTTAASDATSASDVEAAFTPVPDASQAPDTGNGAAAGDIPDNAVFLTYRSAAWQFLLQYVEGWQVTTRPDGVEIRDKDSSEVVSVVQLPKDVAAWVASTDLPSLRSQRGFSLVKQNRVKVGSSTLIHLVYHALSAADPVTGKQVASTVDRFYVPGPALAVISLGTPDGVDNVDAFRQIIGSFRWTAQ